MSSNLRDIREISNDRLSKFTWQLAKKFFRSQVKDQTDKLEGALDIYSSGQDIKSVVRLHNFTCTNSFDFTNPYYSMFEPDNNYLTCWVRGTAIGNTIKDYALRGNIPYLYGDPMLIEGSPHDDGLHVGGCKSLALKLNRPTSSFENREYLSIPHNDNFQVAGISTGVSYFMRFRIHDLDTQGGYSRTLFEKTDGPTPDNGVLVTATETGRLRFYLKRGGTEHNVQTASSTIATDTVYDAWFTYANSGNVQHIWVNNSDKSLTDPGSPTWHSDLTNRDLSIFRRGEGTDGGYTYGDFYDFRQYREKVVSSTEIGYFNTNKLTIANIPFGYVPFSNICATYNIAVLAGGYTTTGYTTIGYTAA